MRLILRGLLFPVGVVSLVGAVTLGAVGWLVSDVSCALLWLPDRVWPTKGERFR